MKTGIGSRAYFDIFDYKEGLKKAKEHGYDCIDFQCFTHFCEEMYQMPIDEMVALLTDIKEYAKEIGIEFYQSHAPWWHITEEKHLPYYEKAIYGSSVLGAENMAIHGVTDFWVLDEEVSTRERVYNYNLQYFKKLLPYAEKYGVTLCMENLPAISLGPAYVKDIKRLVDELNSPYIKACLDTGHAHVFEDNQEEDILLLGKDLRTLHIHDNVVEWNDEHLLPYCGTIDWDAFYRGLASVDFKGVLSLELVTPFHMPEPFKERYLRYIADLARYMANRVEELKK